MQEFLLRWLPGSSSDIWGLNRNNPKMLFCNDLQDPQAASSRGFLWYGGVNSFPGIVC